jgi:hypothetical protein
MAIEKLRTPLDLGNHINAGHQARLKAGAQRTLAAVACMPWFGWGYPPLPTPDPIVCSRMTVPQPPRALLHLSI